MNIYSDEELSKRVNWLNALYFSDWYLWRLTRANKEHNDEFDNKVNEGEYYYKRENGPAFDDIQKLSRASMEKMIYVIFDGNPALEKFCEQIVEEKEQKLHEQHAKYSPLNSLLKEYKINKDDLLK